MKVSFVKPGMAVRYGLQPRPAMRQRRLQVSSLMLPYQYQARAEKLRKNGYDVVEFGERAMREGCFGEDVLQLQNYLAEEQYYNPVNGGYTGYFGAVTKESLQAWQKDHGLPATGVFDSKCKWAYLKQIETRSQQDAKKEKAATVVAVKTTTKQAPAKAAPVAKVAVPATQQAGASAGKASSGSASLGALIYVLAGGAAYVIYKIFTRTTRKYGLDPVAAGEEEYFLDQDGVATDAKTLRKLSIDELQRYIAPMKGQPTSRTPLQRPPMRPLRASGERADTDDPFLASKYGTYYGGKRVLDKVKQNLVAEGLAAPDAIHAAAKRLASLTGRAQPASNAPSRRVDGRPVPLRPTSQPARYATPPPPPPATTSFEDVKPDIPSASPAASSNTGREEALPQKLIAGTDLETEALPEASVARTNRPVNVQRPSRVGPVPSSIPTSTATSSSSSSSRRSTSGGAPQVKPRPVPVVKPGQVPATVGEAMEAAAMLEEENAGLGGRLSPLDETVVLEDRPIKLHKPARLVMGAKTVPTDQWGAVLSEEGDRWYSKGE